MTCLDTSALVRLCLGEGDLRPVEAALGGVAATSVLAAIEMPCAIHARFHRGAIADAERDRLLTVASELLGMVTQIGLTAAIRREAVDVAEGHLIRALDAVHIATATVTLRQQRRRGGGVRFCTADVRQADVARVLLGDEAVDLVPPL